MQKNIFIHYKFNCQKIGEEIIKKKNYKSNIIFIKKINCVYVDFLFLDFWTLHSTPTFGDMHIQLENFIRIHSYDYQKVNSGRNTITQSTEFG